MEKRKDSKTMEWAATAYSELNRVDLEDEHAIVPQPFSIPDGLRVLDIEGLDILFHDKLSAPDSNYSNDDTC